MAASSLDAKHPPGEHHKLEAVSLHVHYGSICALHDVSFSLCCGHCVGLLGKNGAGKSTLLKTIAGLGLDMAGSIVWRNRPLELCRTEIAYLPQSGSAEVDFPITVRGLVEMGRFPHLGNFGRWRKLDSDVVDEAIELLELQDLQHRRLYQLSGGQRQRANLARALAQEAHVLLLDEPYSGLDQPSQEMLSRVIHMLARGGRLVLVSHHDLKTVSQLFDQVLMLNGSLVACGETTGTFTDDNIAKTYDKQPEACDV